MSWLVLKMDEGNILELEEVDTHGLATQKAHQYTDEGFPARVVPEELKADCLHYFQHVQEKRDSGFIREYGKIPNGSRAKGEGARTIGNMIFPAFGGMLEGATEATLPANAPGKPPPSPLLLSSKRTKTLPKKLGRIWEILI